MSGSLNPLAAAANATLERDCPVIFSMLSERGKRMFYPSKGILAQGADAKTKAHFANATIGIAMEDDQAMSLDCINKHFQGLSRAEIFEYSPSGGELTLRRAWAAKQRAETPSLGDHPVSLPVVTNGLTQGISIAADLFLDPDDEVLSSELRWENYSIMLSEYRGARLTSYRLFNDELTGFNLDAFTRALEERRGCKLVVFLTFPNNPCGYTPTPSEAAGIVDALTAHAASSPVTVLCDDAYYSVFFKLDNAEAPERESLFGRLSQAHENLLAIKVDGVSKEEFAWGLRVGFITFGFKNGTSAAYDALAQKAAGVVRATIASISTPAQSIILKALKDPQRVAEREAKLAVLQIRANAAAEASRRQEFRDCWDVYPFNSGYFCCLKVKGASAEAVRQLLLTSDYGVGTIALGSTDLRVAFSSVSESVIPEMFGRIASAIRTLRP